MYLLDTNACIRILNRTSERLVERLAQQAPVHIKLSAVVKAELLYGARRSERVDENLRLLTRFFAPFGTVPFDDPAAEHYGMIRAELARAGKPIGANDLLIAATARAHDLTLVTHNTQEFGRVHGLRIEDWEAVVVRHASARRRLIAQVVHVRAVLPALVRPVAIAHVRLGGARVRGRVDDLAGRASRSACERSPFVLYRLAG